MKDLNDVKFFYDYPMAWLVIKLIRQMPVSEYVVLVEYLNKYAQEQKAVKKDKVTELDSCATCHKFKSLTTWAGVRGALSFCEDCYPEGSPEE